MPTYDYLCSACGHRFELFEKTHEMAVKACVKCGKKRARRQMGAGAGIIFKGSGFYSTDSKKSGATGAEPPKKKTVRKEKKEKETKE